MLIATRLRFLELRPTVPEAISRPAKISTAVAMLLQKLSEHGYACAILVVKPYCAYFERMSMTSVGFLAIS